MPIDYLVETGDCISSIAFDHGFFWETIWNHPQNAELKSKRKDPNILQEGDVVHTPDLRLKRESRPTNQKHKFVRKGAPAKLRLRIMEEPKPEKTQTAGGAAASGGGGGSFFDKTAGGGPQGVGVPAGGGLTKEVLEPGTQPRTNEGKARKKIS